jgi:hypothetical protein
MMYANDAKAVAANLCAYLMRDHSRNQFRPVDISECLPFLFVASGNILVPAMPTHKTDA